jgi:hypothetical protein
MLDPTTYSNFLSEPTPNSSFWPQELSFASDQAQLLSLESPDHPFLPPTSTTLPNNPNTNLLNPNPNQPFHLQSHTRPEPQLEDVASWTSISHFVSLFLQYLYPLLPLVHRPTFAENLATRRDLRDTDFRALLLSIGELHHLRIVGESAGREREGKEGEGRDSILAIAHVKRHPI